MSFLGTFPAGALRGCVTACAAPRVAPVRFGPAPSSARGERVSSLSVYTASSPPALLVAAAGARAERRCTELGPRRFSSPFPRRRARTQRRPASSSPPARTRTLRCAGGRARGGVGPRRSRRCSPACRTRRCSRGDAALPSLGGSTALSPRRSLPRAKRRSGSTPASPRPPLRCSAPAPTRSPRRRSAGSTRRRGGRSCRTWPRASSARGGEPTTATAGGWSRGWRGCWARGGCARPRAATHRAARARARRRRTLRSALRAR